MIKRQHSISNHATVAAVDVGVYSDLACTQNLTSINWGVIHPGQSRNFSAYVKNTGNTMGTLSMNSSSWDPMNASEFITLTWTAEGLELNPGDVSPAIFTLTVSPSIHDIDEFSFVITVRISD